MAASCPLRTTLLLQLVLVCSGQYYYDYGAYYNYYDYGDYGSDNSWCPFGINGMCQCENDIVDCTSQGLSSIPLDLPTTIKQLILKDNRIASLDYMPLATFSSLEFLDLSSNSLRSLPDGIFESLSSLKTINLSGNPWECDCSLKWMSIWMLTAGDRNLAILDASSTNCVEWPSVSMLDLSPADFLPCAVPVRVLRSVTPFSSSPIHTFANWTSVCSLWFSQTQCDQGPSEAGSCVLSHDTHSTAVVTYSAFTSQTDADTCQNYCFANNFTYHAFASSIYHCLCGEEQGTAPCSGCTSNTLSSTDPLLCGGAYMRVTQAAHVLSDVALTFTTPVVAHTPSTFALSGYPSLVTSISWSFGDGAKQENTNLARVSHTYTYPGLFLLRVDLCWSGVCQSVQVHVKVNAGNVQTSLTCPLVSEVSEKIGLNVSLSNSYASEIRWSRTSAAGTVYAGVCGSGWTAFADRCVKFVARSKSFSQAESACHNRGGTLLRLNHLQEGLELPSLVGLSASDTAWIGAEYNGTVYQWKATAAAATLLQALNIDRSVGDCLVMSLTGLVAADCSSQHYVLCQKDPAPCAVGEQLGSSGHCFHLYTSNVTWQQARETCQGLSQGDLAILSGQSITDALFRALGFTSPTWMGLSSPDLLGHYTWVDGELLSWNNWASTNGQTGVQWPCISVAASGQWEAMDCDQMLPFICEYSLNDAVTPDLHVAGTPDLQNSGSSFTKLSEYTLSLPSQAGQTLVMPGVWFAKQGQLLEVNLQVAALSSINVVAVQVLRPTCPSGEVVIRPGCDQNVFAKCGSSAEASSCPSLATCSKDREYICPLTGTCIPSSTPCSCATAGLSSVDCTATDPASDLTYTLVEQAVYQIPATGGSFVAEINGSIEVQANDVLAFQSFGPDLGFCHVDATSQWRQVAFTAGSNNWTESNEELSLSSYTKQESYVCLVSALYGNAEVVSLPDSLAYVPDTTSYTFQAEVVGSTAATKSCTVDTVQQVGDLSWLHPPLISPSTVYVEAGVLQNLVVMVASGSSLEVTWELGTGATMMGSSSATCPNGVASRVASCQDPTSQLAEPFLIFSHTFSLSNPVSLTLNVSNSLGWKSMSVDMQGVELIQNLVLYHANCSVTTACSPLVEVGVSQQFLTSKDSGTVDLYEFTENGVLLSSQLSPNLSRTYLTPGLYLLAVNASNGLQTVEASLQVSAKVRAQVNQPTLEPPSPMVAEVGQNATFTLIATVAKQADLNITWKYGDGQTESSSEQMNDFTLNIHREHVYTVAGTYTLKVILLDAFGVEVTVEAIVHVVTPITSLAISTLPSIVASGNATSITVQVQAASSATPNFGNITYIFSFSDGSADNTHTSSQVSRSVHHIYSTNGTYNISIIVSNQVSTVMNYTTVIVQTCPTKVRLTYDGPKNLSEQLTFTAIATKGSDLNYTFQFDDGSPPVQQAHPVVLHTYNASGTFNAFVVASNDVCSVFDNENVIAMDSNTLVVRKINHGQYAPVNQLVNFTVDVVTLDLQKVDLTWSVLSVQLTLSGIKRFSYNFSSAGNYTVQVTLKLDSVVPKSTSTIISIQEQVSNITMTVPSLVSFGENQPAMVTFLASSLDGTDVGFHWYSNSVLLSVQGPNVTVPMSSAGTFNISVLAFNEVSSVGMWSMVSVLHIVENVIITCGTCINDKFIAKGDLAELRCSYLGTNASVSWRIGGYTIISGSILDHVFFRVGSQMVEVVVSNQPVSIENVTFEVLVEEAVSTLTVTADHSVTSEGSSVQLMATHSEGTNVEYTWQCTTQASHTTTTNTHVVVFPSWGLHTCNVTAANNISSQQASINIKVLQVITSLGIKNLTANNTLYLPINTASIVEADCNTNFEVNFSWNVMKDRAVINTQVGGVLVYHFTMVDHYQLMVKAENAISSKQITVEVEAMEEITNLQLTANDTTVTVGAGIELTVAMDTGTRPTFEWSLNSMPLSAVAGFQSFPYTFSSADTYVIEVNVSNPLSTQTVNITILVQYAVQSIHFNTTLDFMHPYINQNQEVGFVASVAQGSDPMFEWTVVTSSTQHTVAGSALQQNFTETGEYTIELAVSNAVSRETSRFTVYVEKAITSLSVVLKPSNIVITGEVVGLLGVPNADATPVTYSWTVEGQNLTARSFSHSFQNSGSYIIKLLVYNNISRQEQRTTIEVLDPITALQLTDCNMTRQAHMPSTLSVTAQGTNISFSWTVQLPSLNQTASGPRWSFTFPAAGIYPVEVVAINKVGQEKLTCMISVQDTIANVAVSITEPPVDYIFTNQNVTFVVTGDYLNSTTYTWTFVGLSSETTSSPIYITTFDSAQQVTLEVVVRNDVSHMAASINFTVQDLKCNLPVVAPVGSSSRSVLRSKSVQFDVSIDYKDCTQYVAVHTWKIYDIADCKQTLPSTSLALTSVDTARPTLILPVSVLPATEFQFCVHYSMGYQRTPVAEEVFYNLTVSASPLVAVISGGGWRQVDGSEEVCMDGSLSYNPDQPDNPSAGIIYSWMCQAVSGTGSCFLPVTNSSSVLCVSSLAVGITSASYNITLTVSLSGYTSHSTSQMLEVWVTSPPILSVGVKCVSCQATGDYRISSSHHTALSAHCSGCTTAVTYSWAVTEDTGTALSLGPDDTSTGTTVGNLVVLRNTALKDGHSYTFTVTVDSVDGSRTQSKASITLQPNLPPSGGVCTASPDTVTVLQELISVSCNGWVDQDDSDSDLLYEIKVVHNTQSYLLYYGTRHTLDVYIAPWPGSQNGASELVVSVLDESGARTQALSQLIQFRDAGSSTGNTSQELYLAANSTLTMLMLQGDPIPLLQYAVALTQMLNSASTGSLQSNDLELQAMVRTAITVCVSSTVPVETLQQVQQMAYLLSLLTEFSEEYQISGCHTLMIQTLQDIVTVLQTSVQSGLDREDFAFQSLFSSLYHLMEVVNLDSSSTSTTTTSASLIDTFPQFVDLSSQLSTNLQVLDSSATTLSTEHKMSVVSEAFTLAEDVASIVLESMVLDEDSVTFQLGGIQVEGVRTTVGGISSYFEQGGCRFLLPDSMFAGVSNTEEVLKIMIMLSSNPFTWGYIDDLTITTRVPTLSFKYANGSDLSITNLPSTIEVLMFDSNSNNYTITNSSLVDSPHYDPLANLQFETWTLEGGQSKKLVTDGQEGSSGMSALHVQVRIEALPNRTDVENGITPTATIKAYLGAGFEASEEKYTDFKEITSAHMAFGVDHRHYTFFVAEEDFRDQTEYTITLINEDTGHSVNISAAMYLSSCQFYDEASEAWSVGGCSVSEESIPTATVCRCNHLTAFGGSSLVPISSISFTDLAGLELGLNPVALVAVGTILLIYIIGVIFCHRLDRSDLRRISMVPLCGRDGAFKYHITVITGRQIGAGTTAHVGIKLYGDLSKSEARHLTKNDVFQRNSHDTFLIATDNELGNLHKVRVWHDNTGSSPSWYLTQIQVQDLQSGQRCIFPANTWLSLELEDGMLQKELVAAAPEELHSFSRVFHTSFSNNLAERHMWLSIINRPDHSRFTRVQRATCCVTLVYLYMFLNAMWYGLIKDQSDAAASISWSMIGWEEVIIALVSAAAIFPVALFLICIFKRSRSKADVFKQAMRPQSAQTLEIDAMCDMSHYGGSLRTMTPNEDWSTIFERESTTESIPISSCSPRSPPSPVSPRSPRSLPSPCSLHSPRSLCSPVDAADMEQPISSQLRRTTAVMRSSKDSSASHGAFPGSSKKSTVQCIQRTQDLMWNQENILKSWPEKLPSFAEEEREKPTNKATHATGSSVASGSTAASRSAAASGSTAASRSIAASGSTAASSTAGSRSAASGSTAASRSIAASGSAVVSGPATARISKTTSLTTKTSAASALKKTKSAPAKSTGQSAESKLANQPEASGSVTTRKTASFKKEKEENDDHEEFMQRLDEIDRELQKSSSSSRSKALAKSSQPKALMKKHSSRSSQGAIEDLFDSDDEWANEGLETKEDSKKKGGNAFNPRQDPSLDRRASLTSLMRLRAASMHVPSSAGSSFLRRDSTMLRRDSTLHSFMMSEKSRTTLSAMLRNRMQVLGSPAAESGCRLPWFCVYVGYAICVGLSLVSILMVLLYGYNFGPAVALEWLLSVLLAFLLSILVLEPLKVVLLTLYVAVIVKDAEKDIESDSIDVMPSIEANEQLKEVKFRPLGGFALLQAQSEGRKKQQLRTMIRQTVAYLLLTATVLAVANVYFGPSWFRAASHVENNIVYTDTASTGSVDFYNISSTDVFWEWARDVLTPALYRRELVTSEENPLLLGPARLRQIRSTLVDCLTNQTDEVRPCIGRLDFTEDTATYSPGWLNTTSGNASWVYSSADRLDTWSKFGQDLIYTGGGYVQELGTSFNQTLDALQQLADAHWLDRRSRALFVEWTFYSGAEDLFSAVTLLLEFPVSGGVLASHTIKTQRLYIYSSRRMDSLYVCQVLLLIPAVYLLVQTVITICQQKSKFLCCPGNWLQIFCALFSFSCIGLYVACVAIATDALDRFSANWASFTNFELAVHLHEMLRLLHACLLFLLFLKIAGQVRYFRPLSVYLRTLATAFGRLAGATLIFLILLLTYTQLGYLFYGNFVQGYHSFQSSLVTMFGVMKGSADLGPALEHQRIFSHFFFYSFYAFVYGLFVALVIAILQDAYKLTRSQLYFKSSLEPQDYEMIDFMLKRFKLWVGIIKPKPAFRRVKFEGLPSLPSRDSSSAASSWRPLSQNSQERSTPTPDLIASTSNADALDRLLPAWEKLLTLLGTMETLEKEEQRQVGHVQIALNRWSSEQDKKAAASGTKKKNSGRPLGKPPVDPKSKLSRFRSNFQSSNSEASAAKAVQRQSVTPPPSSSPSKPGLTPTKAIVRTLSDHGGQSFSLLERPSSDSQRERPSLGGDLSAPRDKDTFPGSTTQRSRPTSDTSKTRPGNTPAPAGGQAGGASANPQPGMSVFGKKGPRVAARDLAKLPGHKISPEESKKQAWDS